MNKLFDIKRTKMIDEAAFMHKPSSSGKLFGIFLLVIILCNLASGLIVGLVTTVHDTIIYSQNGVYDAMLEIIDAGGSVNDAMKYLEDNMLDLPWWITFVTLFSNAVTIFGAIFYCKKFEKRSLSSMGIRKAGVAVELLLGLAIGALLLSAVFCVLHFSGAVVFERHPFDSRIIRPSIILYFFGYLVKVVADELLYRGFFLTSLSRDTRPIFSALLTALVFSLFNFGSIFMFINSFLFSFLLNVYVLKRGSLWGTIAMRFVWCFGEAAVLGTTGLGAALFIPKYSTSMLLLTGEPGYGLDSGLLATIIFIFAIFIILLLKTKKSEQSCVEIEYFR